MFPLPASVEDRIRVYDQLARLSDEENLPRRVQWALNYYWMQGDRQLFLDYKTGEVQAERRNLNGDLPLLVEECLPKYQAEMGRLMKMDIRPTALRREHGMDGVRHASLARVILDHLTSPNDLDRIKMEVIHLVLMMGTSGINNWNHQSDVPNLGPIVEDVDGTVLQPDEEPDAMAGITNSRLILEPVSCRELSPVPHDPLTPGEVMGVRRSRWVPLEWLKSRPALKVPRDVTKMRPRKGVFGIRPASRFFTGVDIDVQTLLQVPSASYGYGNKQKKDDLHVDYVCVEELFFFGDMPDRLERHVVRAGDVELSNTPYEFSSVYVPLGISRYYSTSGFYGRSFIEPLIPLNAHREKMLANLFQNVEDLDIYATALVPSTWNVPMSQLRDRSVKNKVLEFEPDYTESRLDIKTFSPANAGDTPGKVAVMAGQVFDGLAQQGPLYQGEVPGRLDSLPGLQFTHEAGSVPLSVTAYQIAAGFIQVYKSVLASAPELLEGRKDLPIYGYDDAMMGLRIDPMSGTVSVNAENYPSPSDVIVAVRDQLPSPKAIIEGKLQKQLELQIITPTQYRFIVWKDNLDLPVGNWIEQEGFRKATLTCLLLFGDGETPGMVVPNSKTDDPELFLMVIGSFMAKAEFSYAGVKVREAFEAMKITYETFLGKNYPNDLPRPEEAAAMYQGAQGQMMDRMPEVA